MDFNIWLLIFYVAGTAFGYFLGQRKGYLEGVTTATTNTFEYLLNEGYLRWKRNNEGELTILPLENEDTREN